LVIFVLLYRIPLRRRGIKELISMIYIDIIIALLIITAHFTIGISTFIAIQFPIIYFSFAIGLWLFYIQHQFEGVYWSEDKEWNHVKASLEGSSFYKLPAVLRWFTGNIGYHHIHHLRPRIPNYNLRKCFNEIPELQKVKTITFFSGFKSMNQHLWDEDTGKLVSFRAVKKQSLSLSKC
jgi:omega-6 fatty acid desaturase (delta-12 desaturase)